MKSLEGVGKLFILVAAIAVVLWLLLDSRCNRPTPISEKPLKDAIVRALDSAEQDWKRKEDSLKQIVNTTARRADSLKALKSQADNQVRISADRSAALAAEVKRLRQEGNNDQALEKCDSLASVVAALHLSLSYQRSVTDSLVQAKDQLIALGEQRVEEAIEFNGRMRRSLDSVSILYDDLDKRYVKTVRKANKKYTLAISAGYGVGTRAEPQPFVGITFGRTLIRF